MSSCRLEREQVCVRVCVCVCVRAHANKYAKLLGAEEVKIRKCA